MSEYMTTIMDSESPCWTAIRALILLAWGFWQGWFKIQWATIATIDSLKILCRYPLVTLPWHPLPSMQCPSYSTAIILPCSYINQDINHQYFLNNMSIWPLSQIRWTMGTKCHQIVLCVRRDQFRAEIECLSPLSQEWEILFWFDSTLDVRASYCKWTYHPSTFRIIMQFQKECVIWFITALYSRIFWVDVQNFVRRKTGRKQLHFSITTFL